MGESLPSRRGPMLRSLPDVGAIGGPVSRRAPPSSTRRERPFEVLHGTASELIACVDDCLVVVVETATLPGVEAMRRGFEQLRARHERVCSLAVTERKSGTGMSPEARTAAAEMMREHTRHTLGAAVVCEGTGFRATAVRSVVTALHMASFASHPSKVFDRVDPALAWLQGLHESGANDVAAMAQTVTLLRARFAELRAASSDKPPIETPTP